MKNEKGKLYYGLGLDNDQLRTDAAESRNIIKGIGDTATAEGTRIDNSYKKIAGAATAIFSVAAIKQFGLELIDITGKFQTFQAVLTNTLQSPLKARQAMQMLQDFAATTPFQVDALTGAFVKLANQGFIPTYAEMIKLGDLASSTGKGFDQLAEAIIDAQTGEFERLKEFGIRASKEGEKVTFTFKEQKTQIDFTASSIRDYILSLGDLKGVAGANAEIAKTLTGQYSNLQDTITQTMNKIGQSSEGMLSGALSGTSYLVEHYEEIGRILGVLITSYGTYKAAVIACAVAQKIAVSAGNIKAFFELAKCIKTAKDAQIALNLAMGANPLIKLASILMTVGGLIWAFCKNTSDATDEVTGLNKAMKDAGAEFEKEAAKVEALQSVMNNSKVAYDERKRALTELKSIIPGYNAELTTEGVLINNNTSAIKDYLIQLEKQIKLKAAQEELEEAYRQKRQQEKQLTSYQKELREAESYNSLVARPAVTSKVSTSGMQAIAMGAGSGAAKPTAGIKHNIEEISGALSQTNKTISELNTEIESTSTSTSGTTEAVLSFAEQLQAAAVKVSTLKTQLADLKAGKGNEPDFAKAIKSKQEELTEAEQGYNLLLGIDKKYLKEKETEFEKAEKAVKDMQMKAANDLYSEEIALKRKQITDKVKLIEFDRDTTIAAIEAEKQAYLKLAVASGAKVSDVDTSMYDKRIATVKLSAKIDTDNVEIEEVAKIQKELEALNREYETYEQERTRIKAEYTAKRKKMKNEDGSFKAGFTQGNVDELNRNESEALKAIDETFAMREDTFEAWMNAVSNMSLKQLERVLKQAEQDLANLEKSGGADSKQIAVARAKVNTARTKVSKAKADNDVSPGKRSIKEWEDLYKTLQEAEREFESIGNAVGGVAGEIIGTAGTVLTSTLSMINGIVQLTTTSTTGMQASALASSAAIQTVEKASVILTIISAAMQIAMTIINLFNNDEEYQKEIEKLQGRIEQLQWELDNADAIRLQNNTFNALQKVKEVYAEATREVLKLHAANNQYGNALYMVFGRAIYQNEIMQKSAEKLATAYANISYTADKALGSEKFSGAKEQLQNLTQQQLLIQEQIKKEDAKKKTDHDQIAEWERQIQELGEEANKIINEIVEGIIGGSAADLASELGDAFIEAFQNGEDAAEAWGDKVNDIVANVMKQMLISEFLEKPLGDIFNKYKEKWFKDGDFETNGGIKAVRDSMGEFANDLNGAGATFKTIWDELPQDIKNMFAPIDEAREASEKGIATASQDSVDELNGRMTAVQGHTYSINEILKSEFRASTEIIASTRNLTTGIADNMKILTTNSAQMLQHLAGIETNTDKLHGIDTNIMEMQQNVKSLKSSIDDISLKGIHIRR